MPKLSKDDCFADLKQRILTTDLDPGSDLDEVSLSERYGISRTPLREVLQRLAGEGYVRLQANRGAKVASMDVAVMRVFFQTAPMIYANIARLAAENRTPDHLIELKDAQRDFASATGDGDARASALCNHRFHEVIGRMAHNPYLTAALDRLLTAGRYVVPFWHFTTGRIAHVSEMKYPDLIPLYGDGPDWMPQFWWWDED